VRCVTHRVPHQFDISALLRVLGNNGGVQYQLDPNQLSISDDGAVKLPSTVVLMVSMGVYVDLLLRSDAYSRLVRRMLENGSGIGLCEPFEQALADQRLAPTQANIKSWINWEPATTAGESLPCASVVPDLSTHFITTDDVPVNLGVPVAVHGNHIPKRVIPGGLLEFLWFVRCYVTGVVIPADAKVILPGTRVVANQAKGQNEGVVVVRGGGDQLLMLDIADAAYFTEGTSLFTLTAS
jgi:hypothetical protein